MVFIGIPPSTLKWRRRYIARICLLLEAPRTSYSGILAKRDRLWEKVHLHAIDTTVLHVKKRLG